MSGASPGRPRLLRCLAAAATALAAAGCDSGPPPAAAGPGAPAVQLLATAHGELCDVCEGFVKCRADNAGDGPAQDLTVYHVQTKDFWQQVGTIADWFMVVFRGARDDRRHLTVYTRSAGPGGKIVRAVLTDQEALLSLERGRIDVPGGWIDRRSGDWHREGIAAAGHCEALTPGDAGTLLLGFGVRHLQ